MRIVLLTISLFFTCSLFSQKEIYCKPDTLELTLAYEAGGQFFYGEKRLKKAELVRFNDNKIILEDYQRGVFILPEKNSQEYIDLQTCGFFLTGEAELTVSNATLDTMKTKVFTKTNKTFFGGKKSENVSTVFKYKIVQVKLIAIYSGLIARELINMDRKTKKDPATVSLRCPAYLVSKVLKIEAVK
jgi:hypothetical protein